ncbi:MAG TPA: nucleotidyltransferase domain-containing protein [Anaerolineales bacterium]|nr:nucleotidyltransferase domain-containing protein [Anaerolineales bacterium]
MAEALKENLSGLDDRESRAILDLIERLNEVYPDQVGDILLYGSKARGDSSPDSDIDLLVLMKTDDRAMRRGILQLAARVSLEHDVILSMMVMSEARWGEHAGLSLYHNILRDSRELMVSTN